MALADTVIIESRTGANVTACPPYCEIAGNWANTTLKSTAPGTTASRGGGRYATTNVSSFTIRPTLAEAGGHYFVEVTHGNCPVLTTFLPVHPVRAESNITRNPRKNRKRNQT